MIDYSTTSRSFNNRLRRTSSLPALIFFPIYHCCELYHHCQNRLLIFAIYSSPSPSKMFSCSNQPRGCRGRCDSVGGKCKECRVCILPACLLAAMGLIFLFYRCITSGDQHSTSLFSHHRDNRPTTGLSARALNLRHVRAASTRMPLTLTSLHQRPSGTLSGERTASTSLPETSFQVSDAWQTPSSSKPPFLGYSPPPLQCTLTWSAANWPGICIMHG